MSERPSVPRRSGLVVAIVLALSTAGDGRQLQDPGGASEQGRITGIVLSRDGPLADATVTLVGSTWQRHTTTSDAQGRFAIAGLQPDVYTLTASKDEYLDAAYGTARPVNQGGLPTGIAVGAGARIDGLALRLARGGAIEGTVRDSDRRLAPETMVMLSVRDRAGVFGMGRTDATGAFRIAGLPGADYVIAAYPPDGGVPVYYPGETQPARAVPVRAAEDAPPSRIDVALVRASPVPVTGTVLDSDGRPAVGIEVSATSLAGPFLRATTASDGRFAFDRVVPGRYTLEARTRATQAGPAAQPRTTRGRWATVEIDVSNAAIAGIALRLQPMLLFSGRVRFDTRASPASIDPSTVRVFLTRPGFHPYEIAVRRDGTFAHMTTPGVHLVSAIAASTDARLRSAMAGGRDLLDHPPAFATASGDVTEVVLTFTDRRTELSGRVLHANGTAAAEAFVVIFPTDRALWNEHSPRLVVTRPATDGRYVVRDLPAGDYVLTGVTDLDATSWKTPAFLSAIAATGVTVQVVEGRPSSQDVRLAR
jgi:hypothetical protein